MSGVRGAEVALKRLREYNPDATLFAIRIGDEQIYIDTALAEQIVKLATDYFQEKKTECQQKFDAL